MASQREPDRVLGLEPSKAIHPSSLEVAGGEKMPFDANTTDIPWYDGLLKNPAYYCDAKNTAGTVEYMSPGEYLSRSAKAKGVSEEFDREVVAPGYVDSYAKAMGAGAKFPMPVIDLTRGEQEGKHRALAAEKLGVKSIPVLMVKKCSESKDTRY